MTEEKALALIEQRSVNFYGDDLTAVRAGDSHIYASLTQMCNAIGIDAQGQRRRIERHTVLSKGLKGVDNLSTPGGTQSGYMLRADLIPLWLSGIRVSAVKEELRQKLEKFQEEAAAVLWEAFQEGRLTTTDSDFEQLLKHADDEVVQAYQIAQAVVKLARNQILLQGQVAHNTERIEELEAIIGDPKRHVTPDQASQISQAVKAVAYEYGKQTGRNEFGGVYGELYRKFGVTSYKYLPAKKFGEAMNWLSEWYMQITGSDKVPF
jgi:hypothetical protein